MGMEEQLKNFVTQITDSTKLRTIPAQVEPQIGQMERGMDVEDPMSEDGTLAQLDQAYMNFCTDVLKQSHAHELIPDVKTAKDAEAGLRDNYFHIALGSVAKFGPDTDIPLLAWAAFNKSRYAGYSDEISIVRMLTGAGFNPNLPDDDGMYPLHYMTSWQVQPGTCFRGVRILIKAGADLNAKNRAGDTPLAMLAGSWPWNSEMTRSAEYLLGSGANPHSKASDGSTPLSILKQSQKSDNNEERQSIIDKIEAHCQPA